MIKYSKGIFKMTREGFEFNAPLSPWIRFCIGAAMLLLSASPLIYAVSKLVEAAK